MIPQPSQRERILQADLDTARERIRALEQELGSTLLCPASFALTQRESRVFGVLLKRDLATPNAIMLALYDGRNDGDIPAPKIVDVFICKIRHKLKPFDIKIDTLWGQGWCMCQVDKAKVQAMLAEYSQ